MQFRISFSIRKRKTPDSRLLTPDSRLLTPDCLTTPDYICRMEVNDSLVEKLAQLARLEFNKTEKEEIKKDLQKMISFVEKLSELDLAGTEPLLHMSDEVNVLREDEVKGSIPREVAFKNAPDHDGQYFKVPKIIKR